MKFRTEVEVRPFGRKIGYGSRLFAIGSCFADNMAEALSRAKFRVTANPAGVMFNPASIAQTIRIFHKREQIAEQELTECNGRVFDYRFHGSLAGLTVEDTLEMINTAIETGHKALKEADTVIITFGTAWVYILNSTGETVANCHKQPAAMFTRKRLSVNEIVDTFSELFDTVLKDKFVILTVSPVRHLGDGADENFLSKATLKLAAAELEKRFCNNVVYFPAYEILNDDLRDYRFYADDLVHPSAQAVEYIREKFFAAALDRPALDILPRVEQVITAAQHRPSDKHSPRFAAFCKAQAENTLALESQVEGLDLSAERAYFTEFAQ